MDENGCLGWVLMGIIFVIGAVIAVVCGEVEYHA
nr:MAG TPA: chitin synthase regulator [Caudoviricetes sp.]